MKDKVPREGFGYLVPAPCCKLRISKLKVMRFSAKQREFMSLQASLTASQGAEPSRGKRRKALQIYGQV